MYLESYSLFFGDLFLLKQRLLLGINKIDLVWCSSLQRGKEDSQTSQLGHSFTSICQVDISDKGKKIMAAEHAFVRSLVTFFSVLFVREMSIVCNTGWRTQSLLKPCSIKCCSQAGMMPIKSCFQTIC